MTSIAIFDTTCASLVFVFTLIFTIAMGMFVSTASSYQEEETAGIILAWFITVCFSFRAAIGLCACCKKGNKRWSKINFCVHTIVDIFWMVVYLIVAGAYWISSQDLAFVIVNFSVNGYFDWILYSAWKTEFKTDIRGPPPTFFAVSQFDRTNGRAQRPVVEEEAVDKPAEQQRHHAVSPFE